jgi:hypothetical protein
MICKACGYDDDLAVAKSWSGLISRAAKSGNAIGSSGRGAKGWKYKNERKAYARVLIVWTPCAPTKAEKKRRVYITRYWGKGKRAYDIDNLAWGLKPLMDEIKANGWIKEDSPKWVERIYMQKKSETDKDYIQIVIEELE